MSAPPTETVLLTPPELAELLGIDAEDAGLLATASVRLPKGWPQKFSTRLGPIELSTREVAMILGRALTTVQTWIKRYGLPVRMASARRFTVSPAALVEFFRRRNGSTAPVFTETPRQRAARAKRSRELALAACGGKRLD